MCKSKAGMVFLNRGEKVGMGHYKEFEIGLINIYFSRRGSKKGREIGFRIFLHIASVIWE